MIPKPNQIFLDCEDEMSMENHIAKLERLYHEKVLTLVELHNGLKPFCQKCSGNAHCWKKLGVVIAASKGEIGESTDAMEMFENAAKIQPEKYSYLVALMLNRIGKHKEAILKGTYLSNCAKVEKLCPASLFVEIAQAHLELGKKTSVEDLFQVYTTLSNMDFKSLAHETDIQEMIRGLYIKSRYERRLGLYLESLKTMEAYNDINCKYRAQEIHLTPSKVLQLFHKDVDGLRTYFTSSNYSLKLKKEQAKQEKNTQNEQLSLPQPIFIVSLPRSGSSLLEKLLSRHPDIQGVGEVFGMESFISKRPCISDSEGNILECYPETNVLDNEADLQEAKLGYLKDLYSRIGNAETKPKYIIDKLPSNWQRIPLIQFVFPNSLIIHISRDLQDVALSNLAQPFTDPVLSCVTATHSDLLQFVHQFVKTMKVWNEMSTDSHLSQNLVNVRYEDLVENPKKQVERVLQLLGLDFVDSMIKQETPNEEQESLQPKDKEVYTASSSQVTRPIYKKSLEDWKQFAPYYPGLKAFKELEL